MRIMALQAFKKSLFQRQFLVILLLGFVSGLPAALTASTLQAWFTDAGSSLQLIGGITLLVLPYTFRFLWAPLFDYVPPPFWDRRRGWLVLTQIGLIISISVMAVLKPNAVFSLFHWHLPWLLVAGFITAVLSTSQDIVINAYQIEILPKEERGLGAALYTTGWRVGALVSGALALIMASELGWQLTYFVMASLMGIGLIGVFLGPVVLQPNAMMPITSVWQAIYAPLKDFFDRYGFKTATLFLLLIITYKLGDALALALNTTFLYRFIGFPLATLGLINKTVSLAAALLGGLTAGLLMKRLSLYQSLLFFGFIQGFANLTYAALAFWGKSLTLLIMTAFTENFCSGMGTIALLALLMSLCHVRFTTTQFALLSALAFLGRTIAGPIAAPLVEWLGWQTFFIFCFIMSLPTLIFVYGNRHIIKSA